MADNRDKTVGQQLIQAMEEVIAFQRGEDNGVRVTRYEMVYPDVRELRAELGLSQREFAGEFGFSLSAVRHWEQGKRIPEKSARILLTLISKDPALVRETLRQCVRRVAAE